MNTRLAVDDLPSPRIPPAESVGVQMHRLVRQLYPICRSITGEGVRRTLAILGRHIPMTIREIPTGTPAFDWTVPREWNVRDAYIKNDRGERVVDFRRHNLHVMSYSTPVHRILPLSALRAHLITLPDHPDWIPYRTAYYAEQWAFCLSQRQLERLPDGEYEVCIDATLAPGALTYGECLLPGSSAEEVLLSTHVCHPSLCNDNLSGIAVATFLAAALGPRPRRYSYRFLFTPGTIGAIVWLSQNETRAASIKHGLVLAGLGDAGGITYKQSRRGNTEIDRAVAHVLAHRGGAHRILAFSPYGYDERQFCSPGFDLPVGCLMRTPHDQYPEYHTSADDLSLVSPEALQDSLAVALSAIELLEANRTYRNTNPKCEPQLGRRGLYRAVAGQADGRLAELALLWVLNLSDGRHSLLDIAERAGLPFERTAAAAAALRAHGLLEECAQPSNPADTTSDRPRPTEGVGG